jgi:elongator complex protein 3
MTDLPGATPEGDMECYKQVLQGEDLIPDYMKDYPCLDVDFTKIKEWKAEGKWKPYAEATPDAADLKRVLIYRQQITPPWVRVNRIQRDFKEAKNGELGFTSDSIKTNLAQLVKNEAEKQGIYCQCIRCCEVSNETYDKSEIEYVVHSFTASGAPEYFISAQVARPHRSLLLGFLRLRLGNSLKTSVIPELVGNTALIRELHVYGRVKHVGSNDVSGGAQHFGIGKKLLEMAEDIAIRAGYIQMAVISGIGVRDYYRKRGYELKGTYMMKGLDKYPEYMLSCMLTMIAFIAIIVIYLMYIKNA